MFDERMSHFGSEVEGMKDEHMPLGESHENINYQEAEGINEIVLKFNTELASADLNDPEVFQKWRAMAESARELNPEEGKVLLGKLDERLKELKEDNSKSMGAAA